MLQCTICLDELFPLLRFITVLTPELPSRAVEVKVDRELPQTVRLFVSGNPLPVQVDESGRKHSRDKLAALLTATTHIGTIREEATVVCVGLQELELPALVTLEIIDAAFDNSIAMHLKWKLVTSVKHWHQQNKR